MSSFQQLLRGRYHAGTFHFQKLDEDLVLKFIAGKPIIERPSQLRKVFQFKEEQKQELWVIFLQLLN